MATQVSPTWLLVFGACLSCSFVCGKNQEKHSFSAYFKVHENTRKLGEILETKPEETSIICALLCLKNPKCNSMNFYDFGECELLREQMESGNELEERHGVNYGEISTDCRLSPCSNGGSCLPGKWQYFCACPVQWKGVACEQLKDVVSFEFTTLGASGRIGPTDTSAYQATTLSDSVHLENGIQIWTVPITGIYHVFVTGAAGADGISVGGGKGAQVNGTIWFSQGVTLRVLVGQKGSTQPRFYGGGGGGSFVVFHENGSLIAAAGGGGGAGRIPGDDGQARLCGSLQSNCHGNGGKICAVGFTTTNGGGGGFYSNGSCAGISSCSSKPCQGGKGGKGFVYGGEGGEDKNGRCDGGFGGGGDCERSPGGGGGYSGGGTYANFSMSQAGGGGSFRPTEWDWVSGANTGDGRVVFKLYNPQ
ncbi:keratin, type I cytoskeletal 9 [Nematostella vectensis]|uniref:keratin, type I cytoskeletal 9 n=1 Tax=Nematostella vectensis TaxID=45351 RepID=UPI0020778B52|nr:keratin, type I cytoskeletal 9 [Nematostella vectensis]